MENIIYQISSKINSNKFYIGSAIKYEQRKRQHLSGLKLKKHNNIKLQNHINKYGIDDLYFTVIEKVIERERLIEREQYYINTLKPNFNIAQVAGNCFGIKRSKETKQKLKESHTGLKQSQETIQKRVFKIVGLKRSNETKKKMSDAQKRIGSKPPGLQGKPSWKKGLTGIYSEETIKKMSESAKRRGYNHK